MKALVTGATGFLGRHLCADLLQAGWEVVGVGRNSDVGAKLVEHGVKFISMNLENSEEVSFDKLNIDVLFHCAAKSSVWGSYESFYKANVIATKNIADACVEANIRRFIHVSTPSIYFEYKHKRNISESDLLPSKFVNHYAKTKYLAEQELLGDYKSKLDISIIRPRGIFGEMDTSIMPRLLTLIKKNKLPLPNDGKALIDVTYVKNVTQAMIQLANAEATTFGQIYNISNQQPIEIGNLISNVCQAIKQNFSYKKTPYWLLNSLAKWLEFLSLYVTKKEPKITCYAAGILSFDQTLNINKAMNDFGYSPKYSLQQGIDNYAKWYK